MRIRQFGIIISSLISLANAKTYNFNVISILGKNYSIGVKYNNKVVPLQTSLPPLYTGTINDDNISKYKYVALNDNNEIIEEETISRIYSEENRTINEVYNRLNKNVTIPELPNPLKPMFEMGSEKFQPFPNNIIYNVYAQCDEAGYRNLTDFPFLKPGHKKSNKLVIPCTVTIITPDNSNIFQSSADMHLIGYGSRLFKKLSWNIKFGDKNKFMGRKALKMRGIANDSSLMREKLTSKLYSTIGVPVQEGAYARFFINGNIHGLYLMSDSFNKRWLGAYVHGNPKADIGFTYQLISTTYDGPYCDLKYLGDNYKKYRDSDTYELDAYNKDAVDPKDKALIWSHLVRFTKLYHDWVEKYKNDTSDEAIVALKKFFNIESMLRLLVIDTLTIPLDNFWLIMSNAALYYNPERDNYQIIPYDFDETLRGSWGAKSLNPKNYIEDCITWANYREDIYEHYFVNNLLSHPQIRKRYDIILAEVSRTTFDAQTIYNYLSATANLIRDDVQWNVDAVNNLPSKYDGEIEDFTLSDFDKSITEKRTKKLRTSYKLQEFIEIRGDYCRDYTANIDISDNTNISDDYDLPQKMEKILDSNAYNFNVVSLLSEDYTLGVKYGKNIIPLNATSFPLFTGLINDNNINEYKYVALDKNNKVVEEESISRTYSYETSNLNEVYNRSNKNITLPELPNTLKPMFEMGSKKFQPLPSNIIYNVYAQCDEVGYANVTTNPFFNGRKIRNDMKISCNIQIISPDSSFQSDGSMHLVGNQSRRYKKLSWSIQFSDKNKFLGRKTIKMRGIANDSSLMREKLTTEIYKTVGIPVQEGAYARLFINGDTYGLYLLSDTLNKRWLGAYIHGDEKAKIGFTYNLLSSSSSKGPFGDLKYLGDDYKKYLKKGIYEVDEFEDEEVDPEDISTQWTHLIRFTKLYHDWVEKYENNTTREDKAIEDLEEFFDLESALRLMAVDTLVLPLDNFWLKMSNTALYYNPVEKKYQFLPHDFDQSLVGSKEVATLNPDNYIEDCITWANYNETYNDHYFVNNLLKHPQIMKRYNVILDEISHHTYASDVISNYLSTLMDLIRDDVQWNIDAVNNLNIPYEGKITSFELRHFERCLTKKHSSTLRSTYELKEFIDLRGNYCRAYTEKINKSKD